jgi:hypothetical protein
MNERIRELAEQSQFDDLAFDKWGDAYDVKRLDPEKFAELIVRECLNMCADSDAALQRIKDRETSPDSEYVRYGAADYEWAAAYGKQIDHYESIADKATYAGDKIRDYFGVEE